MVRKSASTSPEDETDRETWLKPFLLAVALILVAGYALTVTEVGEQALWQAKILLSSDSALPIIGAAGAAVAVAGIAFLVYRNRPRKAANDAAEIAAAVANVAGRKEFLETLEIGRAHV